MRRRTLRKETLGLATHVWLLVGLLVAPVGGLLPMGASAGAVGAPRVHGPASMGSLVMHLRGVARQSVSPAGSSLVSPLTAYAVSGTLTGFGRPPVLISGATVTLVGQSCGLVPTPTSCPYVNETTTDRNGSYRVDAPPGQYIVYSHSAAGFGGDWSYVNTLSGPAHQDLRAYPRVAYGNTTYVLPGWNDLSATASNCNAAPPCRYNSVYGTQVPLLSWTQDGAFYVNRTDRLVFDSFATGQVRDVGPWYPLYDDVMYYQGIENTDWITADDAYVYEFGCVVDCQSSSSTTIDFYAVNTTTGRTFGHNFTGVTDANCLNNAQIQMIGENGNSSVAVLITADGTVYAYNLWNRTQWTIESLPYFEANNIYWVPPLNSFVNVEAMGSSSDGISQVRLEGRAPGSTLVTVFSGTYGSGFTTNGVDGVYFNVTTHRLAITAANGPSYLLTVFFPVDGTGTLTGVYTSYPIDQRGAWPDDSSPANSWSSEHRPAMASDAPMVVGIWNGLFENDSWLYEPSSGGFRDTNVSLDYPGSGGAYRQNGQSPAAVENLFVNSSYEILTSSVNCRTTGSSCPLRGTATGTTPGTVWWAWRLGLPRLPYPSTGGSAETLPPGPTSVTTTSGPRSVSLTWSPPTTGADPILNYTLFWGTGTGAFTHVLNLWSGNTTARVLGLSPNTSYRFLLQAWNLHWHNGGTFVNATTGALGPPPQIASATVAPAVVDIGLPVSWNVAVGGGVAPLEYNYSGLPPGCPAENLSSGTCRPTGAGTFRTTVNVSDGVGRVVSGVLTFVVVPLPSVLALKIVPARPFVGDRVTLEIVTGGGTPPLTLRASNLPTGCSGTALVGGNLTCIPTTSGTFVVVVTATDALNQSGSASASVTVLARAITSTQVGTFPLWALAGLTTGIVAGVAVIVWSRRTRRPGRQGGG